ncbi:MAG: hypothetical protein D5S00_06465 [Tindallia sp. MSAO_Bac2]|nr:MAG: hypothetical protein D5S00_06465 [Tindallia sp. MSAO_Bac2]
MKRTLLLALTLMLIFALVATSAQAFTPPGLLKQMERNNSNEELSVGRSSDGELPPGLRGKGTPPGLEKKGLTLPPGLDGRDNLPPGIMMRFIDALNYRDLGDPEVYSIHLTGYDYLFIPEDDEVEATYKAVVKDQYGKAMPDERATLEMINRDDIDGISFDEESGVLTLTSEAESGEIEIKAVSDTDDSVSGSMIVELTKAQAKFVYDSEELMDALEDQGIGIVILRNDIGIEEPLIINRHVIIEGGYEDSQFEITADEDFEGWMVVVKENGRLRLYDVSFDGQSEENDDLEGIVKIEKGADLRALGNKLANAPVGFGVWMEAYDEDEEYEEDELNYLEQNEFEDIDQKVVFYDESGEILYPTED